tara:strand:- start:288 stop:761 length:474 start_codon:yes stop_codon:yes gene_type:complete
VANQAMKDMGNRVVEVDRQDLIETLEANKVMHVADYKDSVDGYKQEALAKLDKEIASATEKLAENADEIRGKIEHFDPEVTEEVAFYIPGINVDLPVPRCYSDQYDSAIAIAKWDVNDTMKLSQAEFRCFVQDNWSWSADFKFLNSTYTSKTFVGSP